MSARDRVCLESVEKDEEIKIIFASYLKKDYVKQSLIIYLDEKRRIESMFFNSNVYGSVEWKNGIGLHDCHRWETVDEAKSPSYLSRRYTAILSDGEADMEYAEKKLVPDVLDSFEDQEIAGWIRTVVKDRSYKKKVDISRFEQ